MSRSKAGVFVDRWRLLRSNRDESGCDGQRLRARYADWPMPEDSSLWPFKTLIRSTSLRRLQLTPVRVMLWASHRAPRYAGRRISSDVEVKPSIGLKPPTAGMIMSDSG